MLEGFNGNISRAVQSPYLPCKESSDSFPIKIWFSPTSDSCNFLGSDVMRKGGYIIDYANQCIWKGETGQLDSTTDTVQAI